jgi:hypothetical protein
MGYFRVDEDTGWRIFASMSARRRLLPGKISLLRAIFTPASGISPY